jgi:TPR repeat protein
MMKRLSGHSHAVLGIALCAGVLTAGCAGSGAGASASSASAVAPPPCELSTLGFEANPISRELRKKLALPDDFKGAVVVDVLPGGPAEAAGIRPNDLVEEIGGKRITNDCDFVDAAYSRACDPVPIRLRRDGASVEAQVIPVDQKAFLEKSCRDGNASGCFRQAWLLWSHNRESDRERAFGFYNMACGAGSAAACAHRGVHLMDMANRGTDALVALNRACDLGSGSGCAHLAFLHATGKVVKKDDRRATSLYVKSCDLGDALGCYNVGLMADQGRSGPRDISLALAKYAEACDSGSALACTNLGFFYEHGQGVQKDSARAVALYQRGCAGTSCQPSNLGGCLNVGRANRDGIGVEKNAALAASIFEEACNRDLNAADVNAKENRARGCSLLGALYLAADGVEKDLTKGRELSELGCERGDSFGCYNAAVLYAGGTGVAADASKAAVFLERACQGGDGEGCHDLGVAYENGTGVARNRRRATELFRKACELGFEKACAMKRR